MLRSTKFKRIFFASFLIIAFIFASCSDDDDNETGPGPSPELTLSTSTLTFDIMDTLMSFTISNSGDATLDWTIISDMEWLTTSPVSGSIDVAENDTIVCRQNLRDTFA